MDFVFSPADILIPECDLSKWAVIACDQYTSEPEYWEKVKDIVGDSPSALNIVLPEIYLEKDNKENIKKINEEMERVLKNNLFHEYKNSMVFVEREQSDKRIRREIIGKIDLEQYDYSDNATAAIRASEKTVVSRIPPRVEIRKEAPLEMPHILLLAQDADRSLDKVISEGAHKFTKLYDFDLMLGGGHIKAWLIDNETQNALIKAMRQLSDKNNGFLFCVGDGNHSLATAKECYRQNPTEKSRYALASVVDIYSDAIEFEPIYRLLFGADPDTVIKDFISYCGGEYNGQDKQKFVCCFKQNKKEVCVKPLHNLPVGTLQLFLDDYIKEHAQFSIDYIHGEKSLVKLCDEEKRIGFLFGGMKKEELFYSVEKEGSLPRKTFSMGHADDKRFYIEARKIN